MSKMVKAKKNKIIDYFDSTAKDYTINKREHRYYLEKLISSFKEKVPKNKLNILDIGCGTGDLLYSLRPKKGVGVDISKKMIMTAKKRFSKISNLDFMTSSAEKINSLHLNFEFDVIILADMLEHVSSVDTTLKNVREICKKDTVLYIWVTNYYMSWVSEIAEFFNLKKEGPHVWPKNEELLKILKKYGFKVKIEYRLLVPFKIPVVSEFFNNVFYKIPFIRRLGYIFFLTCKLK